jgi:hypothetical protein
MISHLIHHAAVQSAFALTVGLSFCVAAPRPTPLTAEQIEVLKPLRSVLDGIAARNRDEVRDQLLPGGMATLIRNGKIIQMSFDAFVERIPVDGTEPLEEEIDHPQIFIDHDLAVIWAPYSFLIDGKVDHRGTELVHLVRGNGRWLIASIGDNSRKEAPQTAAK